MKKLYPEINFVKNHFLNYKDSIFVGTSNKADIYFHIKTNNIIIAYSEKAYMSFGYNNLEPLIDEKIKNKIKKIQLLK